MALKNQYSTNLGLSSLPEFPQKDFPLIWADSLRIRNALKILQGALDSYTGALSEDPQYWNVTQPYNSCRVQNISKLYVKAGEAFTLGQVAYFYNSAGELIAGKADATDATKRCKAYCATPGGVAVGDFGEFILMGVHPFYAGLTPGTEYYLNTTAGSITATQPVTPGNIVQPIGYALDANNLWFIPSLNFLQL